MCCTTSSAAGLRPWPGQSRHHHRLCESQLALSGRESTRKQNRSAAMSSISRYPSLGKQRPHSYVHEFLAVMLIGTEEA